MCVIARCVTIYDGCVVGCGSCAFSSSQFATIVLASFWRKNRLGRWLGVLDVDK